MKKIKSKTLSKAKMTKAEIDRRARLKYQYEIGFLYWQTYLHLLGDEPPTGEFVSKYNLDD